MADTGEKTAAAQKPDFRQMTDELLVAAVRQKIDDVCHALNEADRRKIEVIFSIARPPGKTAGQFKVVRLDISRKL